MSEAGIWMFRVGNVRQNIETPDNPQQPDGGKIVENTETFA